LNAWDEYWDDYRMITGISWEYDRDLMGFNGIQSSQLGIYIYITNKNGDLMGFHGNTKRDYRLIFPACGCSSGYHHG
jgi:hypothetical protein